MADYKYKAKPGYYKRHRYDSQHEIKWAKALDFAGVKYQPHPKWAQSPLWTPDLVIIRKSDNSHILVDIKPKWSFITGELIKKMVNSRAMMRWDVKLAVLIDPYGENTGTFISPHIILSWEDLM